MYSGHDVLAQLRIYAAKDTYDDGVNMTKACAHVKEALTSCSKLPIVSATWWLKAKNNTAPFLSAQYEHMLPYWRSCSPSPCSITSSVRAEARLGHAFSAMAFIYRPYQHGNLSVPVTYIFPEAPQQLSSLDFHTEEIQPWLVTIDRTAARQRLW